jgi:glycosyltransferase involved in cell wall biosynthesis
VLANAQVDLILATDMLDLSTFLALTRDLTHRIPAALYMHENQLTYPSRPGEKRDLHYGFINYASMLAADAVLFNSTYHLESWFDELPRLLKHFPEYTELATVSDLRDRSSVLPLGVNLSAFDAHRVDKRHGEPLLILWNHRWEYDKDPDAFFRAMEALDARGLPFHIAVLGERFVRVPPVFEAARERLVAHLVQFGYAETFAEYASWLWRSDVVVSTAIHEFFGAAVVEAIRCGAVPLLPNRLSYPQFIPPSWRPQCLYVTESELVERLAAWADEPERCRAMNVTETVARYDWSSLVPEYDRVLEGIAHRG